MCWKVRLVVSCCLLLIAGALFAQELSAPDSSAFREALRAKVATLEKKNAAVLAGTGGWLFLTSELRFLSHARFWGEAAAQTGRSRKSEHADPLPAIVDFQRQLRERGIELLLVPVPPKASIYPGNLGLGVVPDPSESASSLGLFYRELGERGIDVLDLSTVFASNQGDAHGAVFCRTDSHWSGAGCALAAKAIADRVRSKLNAAQAREYLTEWKEISINGDLSELPGAEAAKAPEKVAVRTVVEKANGAGVQADANSPLLILGDSHTLVFHEFLSEHAGLIDQLAAELGFAPDLIGTRGSGATAVRISLYRRAHGDPNYLAKKKVVVWCFAAREFTEADQGWVRQPIGK